jgi:hypothetical protein
MDETERRDLPRDCHHRLLGQEPEITRARSRRTGRTVAREQCAVRIGS